MSSQISGPNSIETSHEDLIHDAQLDYYGKRLATCSSDRTIKIYDVVEGTRTQVADLKGHDGPVWQIAWAHPKFGHILASASYDRKVILWKETAPNVWNQIYQNTLHESSVNSISWAPHEYGLILACASSDSTVSIITRKEDDTWDCKKFVAHLIGCNAVSWAPAFAPAAMVSAGSAPPAKRLVTGGCDNLVKIWSFNEGTGDWDEEASLTEHKDWVRDVAWAPSVGVPASIVASCGQDRKVIIWTQDAANPSTWSKTALPFDCVVWRVSWSVTGNILAVSGGDNRVTVWKESLEGEWQNIGNIAEDGTPVKN